MYSLLGIIAYYLRYIRAQFWSDERILNYQVQRIKRLVKSSLDINDTQINYSLQGKDFLEEYKTKVSILDKARVKENPDSFLVRRPSKVDLEFHTSGSSGKPMKAYVSWRHWIVEQAVIYRHWKWHGYRFRDTCAMIRSYSPKEGEPLIKYSWSLNTYYYSPFHLDDEHMEEYYRHMLSKRVKYLRGYPSSIKIFAEFCQTKGYTIPGLKFILTASEVLSEEDRSFIEKVFGVQMGNHYGLAEQIVMFGNCSESSILHNYNEYGYCELIPTDEENIFRIIGTNLHNDLMPLLRYDTGDLAYARQGVKCPCGRAGIQVEAIIGRNDVLIKDSNGSALPTVNFYTMMQYYTTIKEWQFIINRTDDLVLTYTGKELGKIESEKLLRQLNDRLSNTKLNPEIKKVESLNKIAEGKTPRVIYEN
jgi:phenylacetate-CoA ligase